MRRLLSRVLLLTCAGWFTLGEDYTVEADHFEARARRLCTLAAVVCKKK